MDAVKPLTSLKSETWRINIT